MEVVEIEIFVDDEGYLEATAEFPHEALGGFLSSDVQASLPMCDRVLEWLTDAPRSGRSFEGNSCTVTIEGGILRIETRHAEAGEPGRLCRMPLDDFREALGLWKAAIQAQQNQIDS